MTRHSFDSERLIDETKVEVQKWAQDIAASFNARSITVESSQTAAKPSQHSSLYASVTRKFKRMSLTNVGKSGLLRHSEHTAQHQVDNTGAPAFKRSKDGSTEEAKMGSLLVELHNEPSIKRIEQYTSGAFPNNDGKLGMSDLEIVQADNCRINDSPDDRNSCLGSCKINNSLQRDEIDDSKSKEFNEVPTSWSPDNMLNEHNTRCPSNSAVKSECPREHCNVPPVDSSVSTDSTGSSVSTDSTGSSVNNDLTGSSINPSSADIVNRAKSGTNEAHILPVRTLKRKCSLFFRPKSREFLSRKVVCNAKSCDYRSGSRNSSYSNNISSQSNSSNNNSDSNSNNISNNISNNNSDRSSTDSDFFSDSCNSISNSSISQVNERTEFDAPYNQSSYKRTLKPVNQHQNTQSTIKLIDCPRLSLLFDEETFGKFEISSSADFEISSDSRQSSDSQNSKDSVVNLNPCSDSSFQSCDSGESFDPDSDYSSNRICSSSQSSQNGQSDQSSDNSMKRSIGMYSKAFVNSYRLCN